MAAIAVLAPLKTFTPRSKNNFPWMNTELLMLNSCKKRDALGRRYERTQNGVFFEEYLRLASEAEQKNGTDPQLLFLQERIFEALSNKNNVYGGSSAYFVYCQPRKKNSTVSNQRNSAVISLE